AHVAQALPSSATAIVAGPYLDDAAARPLVDEFAVRTQARLRSQAADVRALVETVIANLPTDRTRMTAAMFERLEAGSPVFERLSAEMEVGWRYACAAIERKEELVEVSPRTRSLWSRWSQLAGIEYEATEWHVIAVR